jgi:hypothetical protein
MINAEKDDKKTHDPTRGAESAVKVKNFPHY